MTAGLDGFGAQCHERERLLPVGQQCAQDRADVPRRRHGYARNVFATAGHLTPQPYTLNPKPEALKPKRFCNGRRRTATPCGKSPINTKEPYQRKRALSTRRGPIKRALYPNTCAAPPEDALRRHVENHVEEAPPRDSDSSGRDPAPPVPVARYSNLNPQT